MKTTETIRKKIFEFFTFIGDIEKNPEALELYQDIQYNRDKDLTELESKYIPLFLDKILLSNEKELLKRLLRNEFHKTESFMESIETSRIDAVISIAEKTGLGIDFVEELKKDLE